MKLKVVVDKPIELRKCLSFLIGLRRMCVFRFTEQQLIIVSSGLNEPTVWCKLDSSIFQLYEVDSTRNNVIPFEINIEPLLQVLRNYEKSNVSSNGQRSEDCGADNGQHEAGHEVADADRALAQTSRALPDVGPDIHCGKSDRTAEVCHRRRTAQNRGPVERAAGRSARRRGCGAAELGLECATAGVAESEAQALERWCEVDGAV
ncbi:hypothetical protein KL949_003348 [Ogataea haglerorum]|nr:hypothetical protein KL913_003249 [Ogataea haglerorum]KAG7717514.1 hypothetical protein KL949_003348 [Ogataea haglerorum]KAG7740560.1 hypothetical protein KL932_002919 [Ogataea haglerorum]KAG7766282.1 hypothetical protein KL931_004120 [Ogataea haglerorum]